MKDHIVGRLTTNMVVEMELVNEFEYQSSAWVTRLECMKAVNDEVKQARRDQSPPERPQAGPYSMCTRWTWIWRWVKTAEMDKQTQHMCDRQFQLWLATGKPSDSSLLHRIVQYHTNYSPFASNWCFYNIQLNQSSEVYLREMDALCSCWTQILTEAPFHLLLINESRSFGPIAHYHRDEKGCEKEESIKNIKLREKRRRDDDR